MDLKYRNSGWFVIIIAFLLISDITIILDIPFLRQLMGFLFLTFLPGFLIIQILKLNKIDPIEKFVLTVGLSIFFLMFFGLLLNILSIDLGNSKPLSKTSLLFSFNIIFILLIGIAIGKSHIKTFFFERNLNYVKCTLSNYYKNWLQNLKLTASEKGFLIIPILFPVLSIFGMHVMNTTNNNSILLFLLILIPTYITLLCIFNQEFSNRLYPFIIFLISISLILMLSLRSNHLIGIDTHKEYYFFQITLNSLYWRILGFSTLDTTLSISLLPAIYQSTLNMSSEFLFKILYSLIYSISPLVIYIISRKYVEDHYAFLAANFFMFQHIFLETASNARTTVAILFFGLSMMILFNDKIHVMKKRLLLIFFFISNIVSHYSTTYIFFVIMIGAFVGVELLSKKYTFKREISLKYIILFFILIFFWYSQITNAAFNEGINFIEKTIINLNNLFIEESRSSNVPAVFGSGIIQKGTPHKIEFVLTWLIFAFIGIGIFTLIKRYKEMSFLDLNMKKPLFLREKFEVEYCAIALVCIGLLIAIVVLPFVSVGYGIDRLYSVAITILSVFFVIGGITIARYFKVQPFIILLLILVPYFFSITGVTYNIYGVPRQIIINSEGEMYDILFVNDREIKSVIWLEEHRDAKTPIFSDFYGRYVSISYGNSLQTSKWTYFMQNKSMDGYIYLRSYNINYDKIFSINENVRVSSYNLSDYADVFTRKKLIYNNNGAEIYR
jgi:uncharacterized membrane protein